MKATTEDVLAVADLVMKLCGIYLDTSKGYLIEHRLTPLATELGCKSFAELAHHVRHDPDGRLRNELVDAVSTNETLFFRDNTPFEALKHKVLPELIDAKARSPFSRRLRLWSAACSTGQEPYSLAMTLCELIPNIHAWDVSILGSDISNTAIAKASAGVYERHEIERGLPTAHVHKYFEPTGNRWRVKDTLRALVTFERRNLLTPFDHRGTFDVIFCRNVAIYFTLEARRDLFLRLAAALTTDGYLFVGSSESLSYLGPQFRSLHHCRAVYYQPNRPQAATSAKGTRGDEPVLVPPGSLAAR